jgi:hypothetical protein
MGFDFEALRAKTAADNAGLLTKTNNRLATVSVPPPKVPPKPRPTKKRESLPPPSTRATRSSRRLAEATGDKKHKLEDGIDQVFFKEPEPKRLRKEGDLELSSIAGKTGIDGLQNIFRGAQPGLRTFDPSDVVDSITDKASKGLIRRFEKFRLYHKFPGPGT